MPARKRRPRPVPLAPLPPGLIRTECSSCGLSGGWDPRRGVVVHPWSKPCVVRWVETDELAEAAA